MTDRQYQAARLAEIRSISKDVHKTKELVTDILEILKMNTYGESNTGVQISLDDICNQIINEAKCSKDEGTALEVVDG